MISLEKLPPHPKFPLYIYYCFTGVDSEINDYRLEVIKYRVDQAKRIHRLYSWAISEIPWGSSAPQSGPNNSPR